MLSYQRGQIFKDLEKIIHITHGFLSHEAEGIKGSCLENFMSQKPFKIQNKNYETMSITQTQFLIFQLKLNEFIRNKWMFLPVVHINILCLLFCLIIRFRIKILKHQNRKWENECNKMCCVLMHASNDYLFHWFQ